MDDFPPLPSDNIDTFTREEFARIRKALREEFARIRKALRELETGKVSIVTDDNPEPVE